MFRVLALNFQRRFGRIVRGDAVGLAGVISNDRRAEVSFGVQSAVEFTATSKHDRDQRKFRGSGSKTLGVEVVSEPDVVLFEWLSPVRFGVTTVIRVDNHEVIGGRNCVSRTEVFLQSRFQFVGRVRFKSSAVQ